MGNLSTQKAPQAQQASAGLGAAVSTQVAGKQATLGNAAMAGQLAGAVAASGPSWSRTEVIGIQRELARLGLYTMKVDGDLGKGSRAALVEAFGGEEYRTLSATDALKRLQGATPPKSTGIRYGEMFKDGLLDMNLGLGFDESNWHNHAGPAIMEAIKARGFKDDAALAASLYKKSGREVGDSAFGKYFVKQKAITWKPPAGEARTVDVVIRFVTNSVAGNSKSDGEGKRAADAFMEGMQESDVSYYAGHGRYGSGPDFDRNMRFQLMNDKGDVEKEYSDYTVLEKDLAALGKKSGKSAWTMYQEYTKSGKLKTIGSNDGNLFMNPTNNHTGEFGGNLMYQNLKNGGKKPVTGAEGAMGQTDRNYRLMVFDGCRTQDYKKQIRGTPNSSSRDLGLIDTTRTTYWGDEAETIGAFIDGVLATESSKGLTGKMDAVQQVDTSPAFEFS
ncbi:MAG: hypothetical protein FJ102_02765 [Deltaproteobacteria bacterium]|nr:hypothetical protein [Deltaproteobacteria bacterium]